jgi:hypothetical protein
MYDENRRWREAMRGALMCASVFAVPLLLELFVQTGKLICVSIVGVPLGLLLGGLLGYLRTPPNE